MFLTNLDPIDTENIMLDKLSHQVDGTEWSWDNLNTLCWAIGSISGAQSCVHPSDSVVAAIDPLLACS